MNWKDAMSFDSFFEEFMENYVPSKDCPGITSKIESYLRQAYAAGYVDGFELDKETITF